jgi:hypothetical protein
VDRLALCEQPVKVLGVALALRDLREHEEIALELERRAQARGGLAAAAAFLERRALHGRPGRRAAGGRSRHLCYHAFIAPGLAEAASRSRRPDVDDVGERDHRGSIERLSRTRLRVPLARGHLLYGEWLLRRGRPIDAREGLRTARDMLDPMGLEAFADHARRALLAAGETARKSTVGLRGDLTPQ